MPLLKNCQTVLKAKFQQITNMMVKYWIFLTLSFDFLKPVTSYFCKTQKIFINIKKIYVFKNIII